MRAKNRRHTAASRGVTEQSIVASTAPFNGGRGQALDVTLEVLLSYHPLGHWTVIASRYASSAVARLGAIRRRGARHRMVTRPMVIRPWIADAVMR
jgi:hypothetical protein